MNKVSVFRNGAMTVSEYTGEVKDYAVLADSVKPEGRAGRLGSLYATATLPSVIRWVDAHISLRANRDFDLETYEFKVDADSVYTYPLAEWEKFSWGRVPSTALPYWTAGMTLTDFLARGDLPANEWEVLVKPEQVLSTPRRVTRKRLASATDSETFVYSLQRVGIK